MSTQSLERDLAQYLENTGYEVTFRHAHSYNFFYCYVIYNATIIGERTFHGGFTGGPSYHKAAKWALRLVREHQAAMRLLGGLVRT